MVTSDTNDLLQLLEQSRSDLHSAVAAFQDQAAATARKDGQWSALDCVEHLAAVEERFVGWLKKAERSENGVLDKQKAQELLARVSNRTTRVQAPEAVIPVGRFPDLQEALKHFDTVRDDTAQFAKDLGSGLDYLTVDHPRFGTLNGTEVLMVVAGHTMRHTEQIRELVS